MCRKILALILAAFCLVSCIGCSSAPVVSTTGNNATTSSTQANITSTPLSSTAPTVPTQPPITQPATDVWNGTIATAFAGGSGSEDDPFRISTCSQLAFLAQQVNIGKSYPKKYFILENDLDLNQLPWIPIGNGYYRFEGYFDGLNHTISNIYIDTAHKSEYHTKQAVAGLFGYCRNSILKNLRIDGVRIHIPSLKGFDDAWIGVLAGCIESQESSVIKNIHISNASLSVEQADTLVNLGGCVGQIRVSEKALLQIDRIQCETSIGTPANTYRNHIGGIMGFLYNQGVSDISNIACYTDLMWTGYKGDNSAAAFATMANSTSVNLSNIFSHIHSNRLFHNASNYYSYTTSAIVVSASRIENSTGTYYFKNVFGSCSNQETDRLGDLYHNDGYIIQNNCGKYNSLPENHGFSDDVWDLRDPSKPLLW